MPTTTERILKDVSGAAEDLAARSKKFYDETVDRLPEGSEPLIALAAGGIVLSIGAFILGRSLSREKPILEKSKELGKEFSKELALDFKPVYRLARLWLIARMVH